MLQIGDVDFDTAAGDDYNFIFAGVAEPADVVAQVDQATRVAAPDGLAGDRSPRSPALRRAAARLSSAPASRCRAPSPAASRSASARSVRSQVKSWSSRPKWP